MSKSSEEARQWMSGNVMEDDDIGYGQYNAAMEELFLTIENQAEEVQK